MKYIKIVDEIKKWSNKVSWEKWNIVAIPVKFNIAMVFCVNLGLWWIYYKNKKLYGYDTFKQALKESKKL